MLFIFSLLTAVVTDTILAKGIHADSCFSCSEGENGSLRNQVETDVAEAVGQKQVKGIQTVRGDKIVQ